MCGILGILANKGPISNLLYDGLLVLQHRGQDAAGIVVCDEDKLHLRKDNGLVNDVFQKEHIHNLRGKSGIAHVRYPTAGTASAAEAQPIQLQVLHLLQKHNHFTLITHMEFRLHTMEI